jgi:arylsulfatase A-like enzyme
LLVAERDAAVARAATAMSVLGDERWSFVFALVSGVTLIGALIGFAQAGLRALARRPDVATSKTLRHDVAYTSAVLVLLVAAKTCAAPALLAPALPLPMRLLTWTATHLAPDVFLGLLAVATLFALVKGLVHRRRAATAAAASSVCLAFLVSALGSQGCGNKRRNGASSKPNVLVVAADSIRPDHLSALGYPRPTTPNIDRLIGESALFERTMAPLAMTTPSWLSILTGRYPHGHGVRHMFPHRQLRARSLDTLPKIAAENGYRTVVISDYAGDFFPIFDFGFATQRTSPPLNTRTVFQREILTRSPLAITLLESLPEGVRPSGFRYLMNGADGDRLADEVLAEIDTDDRPFFIVVFLSTTHVPFASRYPEYKTFASPEYGGEHAFAYNLTSIADLARAETTVPPSDAKQLIALYDGALQSVDASVGRVLEGLSARGLDASTFVLFTSDHGENLFEPGQTTMHGKWFRGGDEANRVPLVVRGPSVVAGRRASVPVSLVDVAPTVTELLGWRAPDRVEGRSLTPVLRGGSLEARPVFAETGAWLGGNPVPDGMPTPPLLELLSADPRDDGQIVLKLRHEDAVVSAKHRSVWQGDLKLVYEPTLAGANVYLFDMKKDPSQRVDLAPKDPRTGNMLRLLLDWVARDPEREIDSRLHVVRRDG